MMTARHQRYLRNYPARIARERRHRRVLARRTRLFGKNAHINFRRALAKYLASPGRVEVSRKNKPTVAQRIKNIFKPSV